MHVKRVRVERDSITRGHESAPLYNKVLYEPGPRGDKALEQLLGRQEAAFTAASSAADRAEVLSEISRLAGHEDLDPARRASVLDCLNRLQPQSDRMLQRYLTATKGMEKRESLVSLQSHLNSTAVPADERKRVQDELRAHQAGRVLATLGGESERGGSMLQRVAKATHPLTRTLMPLVTQADSHTTYSDASRRTRQQVGARLDQAQDLNALWKVGKTDWTDRAIRPRNTPGQKLIRAC